MPRYYFDAGDPGGLQRDQAGIDLAGIDDVEQEVRHILFQMGSRPLPNGRVSIFVVEVRDAAGVVYRGDMTLKLERLGPTAPGS